MFMKIFLVVIFFDILLLRLFLPQFIHKIYGERDVSCGVDSAFKVNLG